MSLAQRPKLGEMLLARELLQPEQLAHALENQLAYGGRIGTNLVELGYAKLDDVARALVAQLGVPRPDATMLGQIDSSLLPADVCARHQILPLVRDETAVHLAMLDPSVELISRLRAHFDHSVKPYVLPELRLLYLLEKHHGIERPPRFLRVPDGGEADARRRRYLGATVAAPSGRPLLVVTDTHGEGATSSSRIIFSPIDPDDSGEPDEPTRAPGSLIAGAAKDDGAPPYNEVLLQRRHPTPPQGSDRPIHRLLKQLEMVANGAEIAQLLVTPLCPETAVTFLFWVRGRLAVACHASEAADRSRLARLVVPLEVPSLLLWALQLEGVVHAQGDDDGLQQNIARFLGHHPPREVCVAPVRIGSKLSNLICVHSRPGLPFPETVVDDLRALTEGARQAYERLRRALRR
jgi:hypothetical protein